MKMKFFSVLAVVLWTCLEYFANGMPQGGWQNWTRSDLNKNNLQNNISFQPRDDGWKNWRNLGSTGNPNNTNSNFARLNNGLSHPYFQVPEGQRNSGSNVSNFTNGGQKQTNLYPASNGIGGRSSPNNYSNNNPQNQWSHSGGNSYPNWNANPQNTAVGNSGAPTAHYPTNNRRDSIGSNVNNFTNGGQKQTNLYPASNGIGGRSSPNNYSNNNPQNQWSHSGGNSYHNWNANPQNTAVGNGGTPAAHSPINNGRDRIGSNVNNFTNGGQKQTNLGWLNPLYPASNKWSHSGGNSYPNWNSNPQNTAVGNGGAPAEHSPINNRRDSNVVPNWNPGSTVFGFPGAAPLEPISGVPQSVGVGSNSGNTPLAPLAGSGSWNPNGYARAQRQAPAHYAGYSNPYANLFIV